MVKNKYICYEIANLILLTSIVGTYECKIDAKGRLSVPALLKKQLATMDEGFVLKRSVFEPCLELWPMQEWNEMMVKINALNPFVKKNGDFIRRFMAGVKMVEIDDVGRLLIARDLMEFAGISKEVVLSSKVNVVEIWDKQSYEAVLNDSDVDFGALAEEVMGKINFDE